MAPEAERGGQGVGAGLDCDYSLSTTSDTYGGHGNAYGGGAVGAVEGGGLGGAVVIRGPAGNGHGVDLCRSIWVAAGAFDLIELRSWRF